MYPSIHPSISVTVKPHRMKALNRKLIMYIWPFLSRCAGSNCIWFLFFIYTTLQICIRATGVEWVLMNLNSSDNIFKVHVSFMQLKFNIFEKKCAFIHIAHVQFIGRIKRSVQQNKCSMWIKLFETPGAFMLAS